MLHVPYHHNINIDFIVQFFVRLSISVLSLIMSPWDGVLPQRICFAKFEICISYVLLAVIGCVYVNLTLYMAYMIHCNLFANCFSCLAIGICIHAWCGCYFARITRKRICIHHMWGGILSGLLMMPLSSSVRVFYLQCGINIKAAPKYTISDIAQGSFTQKSIVPSYFDTCFPRATINLTKSHNDFLFTT